MENIGSSKSFISKRVYGFVIIGFSIIIISYIQLFISEKNLKERKVGNYKQVCKAFWHVVQKKGAKIWIVLTFLKSAGLNICLASFKTIIVEKGLDKEILVEASTAAGPFVLIGSLFAFYVLTEGKLMKSIYWLVWIFIPMMYLDCFTIAYYTETHNQNHTFWCI